MNEFYLVYVDCPTYNQSSYIRDSLDGFCSQKTSFPFVCGIVDDASTDGEQDVIHQYLVDNFDLADNCIASRVETEDYIRVFAQHKMNKNCFFIVFYLKYNHYQNNKSRFLYISEWRDRAKYIAVCEGDDYWISPYKLQKQVDFLESNPDYTMTCHRTQLYSVRQQRMIGENYCYDKSCNLIPKDVIYRGGLFISTCSILFREEIQENKPDYWTNCKVGDYPLQIACVMKGKAYYINELMSVYRVENSKSWMGSQRLWEFNRNRLEVIQSQVEMFRGFSRDYPVYSKLLNNKIAHLVNSNVPRYCSSKDIRSYYMYFSKEISSYSILQKLDFIIMSLRIPKLIGLYIQLFHGKYRYNKKMY